MATTFNEFYLEWRNRTRRYSRPSLLGAAIHLLDESSKRGIEGLGSLPWLSLLAIKWICQDKMLDHSFGETITQEGYTDLINRIWNEIDQFRNDQPLELQMRRILRPQVGFQRVGGKGFVREAALIDRLEPNHTLRVMFERKTNLPPKAVLDLFFCLYAAVMGKSAPISIHWFSPLAPLYGPETIRSFFSLVSRDLPQLLSFCRALPDALEKRPSEAFEFPALVRYPFARSGDSIRCLHPMLYYRTMEGHIHTLLSEEGQDYMDRFGKVFEAHVVQEAKSIGVKWHGEDDIRRFIGNQSEVPDLLLEYPSCNVFIESKAGMFDESVMTVGASEIFSSKLRAVRKAMRQGWSAATGIRNSISAPPSLRSSDSNYLLIITNKDLYASSGQAFANMARPGEFDPLDMSALSVLPRGHIYVISIDDFERLVSAARNRTVDLPSFLKRCADDDATPSSSKLFFEGHLASQQVPPGYSTLVESAYDSVSDRISEPLRLSATISDRV